MVEWVHSGSRKGAKESLEALVITQAGSRFRQKAIDFMVQLEKESHDLVTSAHQANIDEPLDNMVK